MRHGDAGQEETFFPPSIFDFAILDPFGEDFGARLNCEGWLDAVEG